MRYVIECGKANAGLSPRLTTFVRLDTLENATPLPDLYEIASTGSYYFDYIWLSDTAPDVFWQMDLGPSVAPENRFRAGTCSPQDEFLDKRVSKIITDKIEVQAPPVNLQPVIDAVTAIRTFIMGPDNKNISDVYGKVQNLPASGIAGQAEVDASLLAARTEIDAAVAAARDQLQTNLSNAVSAAQTALQNLVVATRQAIMGTNGKSITDVDAYTKNLPSDPASQATLVAAIAAARDSTNATILNAFLDLRGENGETLTDIFDKVKGLPAEELAQKAQVAALPAAILALIGGDDFDSSADTLHRLRAAIDGNAATLAAHGALLARVLGMMKENAVLDNCTYDGENNLTSARLRLYDSKEHANAAMAAGENDDSTPGKIAEYVITGNYIGGLLESYLVTRETP